MREVVFKCLKDKCVGMVYDEEKGEWKEEEIQDPSWGFDFRERCLCCKYLKVKFKEVKNER